VINFDLCEPKLGRYQAIPILMHAFFFFFCFVWVTGELSTLRQLMKVPDACFTHTGSYSGLYAPDLGGTHTVW